MEVLTPEHYPAHEPLTNAQARKRLRHITSCAYCGLDGTYSHGPDQNYWHIDHVTPTSKGGQSIAANLVKSCATCNTAKGANTGAEWHPRRSSMTAALKPYDWKVRATRQTEWGEWWLAEIRYLEEALDEHINALENLRQRIRIAELFKEPGY